MKASSPRGGDQKVAGVGIGVEEPVLEDLLQVGLERELGEVPGKDAERPDAFQVVDAHPVHELHGEQAAPRIAPVDPRDDDIGKCRHVPGKLFGVLPLLDEIELPADLRGEFLHQAGGVVDRKFRVTALDPPGERLHDGDIVLDRRPDARPLYLHRHFGPVLQHRPVHLGEGGGREGLLLERGEHLRDGAAVLLDDRPHRGKGQRGHAVGQCRELGDQLGREEIAAQAHELPELDEGGPELLEGEAHPARGRAPVGRAGGAAHAEPGGGRERPVDGDAEPVFHQHAADLTIPLQLMGHETPVCTRGCILCI